ncbi:enoyl-ACP reductase FabV [Cerasicoccus arenae]|uniref:Enoyl-[acyl-carrier-protein] reductase [NADH] n=1 Tax=Cerasicoccus arenae TaxID=424488 RepID=A0A8J3GFM2_9BACT|nr:enoyl-ACP reductase FabV [Cerasicoccus arenae]MBK1859925.1 trans-2-enoyl-CoA reductase family protein [Cerasicoccus arenae]GHC12996.1 enoyl-[acyl-carrier-protein] reductase [NADH] [Cerasicoccus arenae]
MTLTTVKPRVRGFVCVTAHPTGCAKNVQEQIDYVKAQGPVSGAPKKVLVIGSSTGYGLSSRIAAAFGGDAATLGVFFERPSDKGRPASAGWYNSVAFENAAHAAGLYAKSINGDAFSNEIRQQTIDTLKADLGQVDLVIYSLASPRRTDPATGEVFKSTLKPIGKPFSAKSVDTDKGLVTDVSLEASSGDDVENTIKVMGGEDWTLWMNALKAADALAPDAKTIAYSYIGPEVTFPIYREGTIGKAKEHLELTANGLRTLGFNAYVSVNKAVVTQASSAIPVVPLYIAILFKIMKEKGLHEGCIEQMDRMMREKIYVDGGPIIDDRSLIRVDDWEMREDIQEAVKAVWGDITSDNLMTDTDFASYQKDFLRLFGFGVEGVDYDAEVDVEVPMPSMA